MHAPVSCDREIARGRWSVLVFYAGLHAVPYASTVCQDGANLHDSQETGKQQAATRREAPNGLDSGRAYVRQVTLGELTDVLLVVNKLTAVSLIRSSKSRYVFTSFRPSAILFINIYSNSIVWWLYISRPADNVEFSTQRTPKQNQPIRKP